MSNTIGTCCDLHVILTLLILDEFNTDQPNNSNYPPPYAGPSLLDNNESDLLRSFFENPNSLDPAFLHLHEEYQAGVSDNYSQQVFDWPNVPGHEPVNTAASLHSGRHVSSAGHEQQMAPYGTFDSAIGQYGQDEYAAAKVLAAHHNGRATHWSGARMSYEGTGNGQNPIQGPPLYPPHPSYQNPSSYVQPLSNNMNGVFDQSAAASSSRGRANTSGFAGSDAQRSDAVKGKGGPLNFGSDDKFRNTNYAAPLAEPLPDKQLSDVLKQHIEYNKRISRQSPVPEPHASPETSSRKRPRATEACTRDDAEHSSADERVASKKSRKNKGPVRDADEDEGEGEGEDDEPNRAQGKDGKRSHRKKSHARKESVSVIDERRRKSSPTVGKGIRENLTEEQKRSNHIQSEQKRRNLIKEGFEDLHRMVPELRSGGFSKSNMLVEAAAFMRKLRDENQLLREQLQSLDNG